MVSALLAGSFDKGMEQLMAKLGDSFRLAASYIQATGGVAGTTKKQKFRAAAAMVGNLELVLLELKAQDITAKDFFVIHLGLSSLLAPAQRAWHLRNCIIHQGHGKNQMLYSYQNKEKNAISRICHSTTE